MRAVPNAWFYYALHTFNFRALLSHPLACDSIIVILLLFGLDFVFTGIVVGYQRAAAGGKPPVPDRGRPRRCGHEQTGSGATLAHVPSQSRSRTLASYQSPKLLRTNPRR